MPLCREPRALVEAVLGSARLLHRHDGRDERALRRRAPRRQLEQRRLVDAPRAEAPDDDRHAQAVAAPTRGRGDLEQRASAVPIRRRETLRSSASRRALPHHQPATRERGREQRDSALSAEHGAALRATRAPTASRGDGERAAFAEAIPTQSAATSACGAANRQGATRSRSSVEPLGPIPGIASSSSTLANAPCCCR